MNNTKYLFENGTPFVITFIAERFFFLRKKCARTPRTRRANKNPFNSSTIMSASNDARKRRFANSIDKTTRRRRRRLLERTACFSTYPFFDCRPRRPSFTRTVLRRQRDISVVRLQSPAVSINEPRDSARNRIDRETFRNGSVYRTTPAGVVNAIYFYGRRSRP